MAVHDLLRELVETRGSGVVGDADQFRGALDDFLDEHEASRGEINLLVDAVRLGAVTRIVAMLDHGADPAAALDEVAVELARDRGADSATGARWALGVITYALGKADASHLTSDRPSSIPAPAVAPVVPVVPAPAPTPEATQAPPIPTPASEPKPASPADPEPARPVSPPTNVVDGDPPSRPGTMTMPEFPTERVPGDGSSARSGGAPPPFPPPPPPSHHQALPPPSERKGRGKLVAVLAALLLVVAAAVAGVLLLTGGDDEGDPDRASDDSSPGAGGSASSTHGGNAGSSSPGPTDEPVDGALPVTAVVLPVTVDGDTSLYVLDTDSGDAQPVSQGADDRLPSVSPDRSTVIFLRPEQRGTGLRSPYVYDIASGEERPLLDDSSPCVYTSRPVWNPSGDRLAITCADENNEYAGAYVVGLDGQEQESLNFNGVPEGGITWTSDSSMVYARAGDAEGDPTTLWAYDLGNQSSEQLTDGSAGFDSHPDWSEENGVVLFQRSDEDGPDVRGQLWTLSPYDGEKELEIGRPVAHGALSADGSLLLFVIDTDDGERLASAPFASPSNLTIYDQLPGEPGAPAGGAF